MWEKCDGDGYEGQEKETKRKRTRMERGNVDLREKGLSGGHRP